MELITLLSVLAEAFCFFATITGGLLVFATNIKSIPSPSQGGTNGWISTASNLFFGLANKIAASQEKTIGLPTIKSQYMRSLINLHENIFWCWIASVPIWIATRIIWFFAGESLNFLFVLALMIACASFLFFITLFWTVKLPNSNSVLRVKSAFFAKYMELVTGNDPIEVAWKYSGGVLGITKVYHFCIGEEINTENEDELEITITVTYLNDVAPLKYTVYYKPAAQLVDVLGSRGKTAKDREKNVRSEVGATTKALAETLLTGVKVLEAQERYQAISQLLTSIFTADERSTIDQKIDEFLDGLSLDPAMMQVRRLKIGKIIDGFFRTQGNQPTRLESETGLTITKIIVSEIDQSKDAAQAHIARGNMGMYREAAEDLVEQSKDSDGNPTMDLDTAMQYVMIMGDEAEGYFIKGLNPNDKHNAMLAANLVGNKKKNGNGNNSNKGGNP